ncbi:MAG: hypothetical protein AB8B91_12895 [Rubripirellula sp.]
MSIQHSTENRKQPPSIYTVMLLLSMVFMLIATIAMWVEINRWAPDYWSTGSAKPQVMVIPADNIRLG